MVIMTLLNDFERTKSLNTEMTFYSLHSFCVVCHLLLLLHDNKGEMTLLLILLISSVNFNIVALVFAYFWLIVWTTCLHSLIIIL